MPGASDATQRVKILNANWLPAAEEGDGRFEVMLVTEDGRHHILPAGPAAITALVALAGADTVLAWDPENRSLIVANVIGSMPWTSTADTEASTP